MTSAQTNSAAELLSGTGVDLHLELTGPGLQAALIDGLREAVRSGRLAPGTRLPASRTLAVDLGIARSTVTECYAELVAEGWLAQRAPDVRVKGRARAASGSRASSRNRTPRSASCSAATG
jgi:GntR family transcriptional regulator/MocR family aminotransferase